MAQRKPSLEHRLWDIARKRGYSKTRARKFVYGTLRKIGWRPRKTVEVEESA